MTTKTDEQERDSRRLEGYNELADRLEYVDGKLIWKKTYARYRGKEAGKLCPLGYRRIHLLGVGMFAAHRIIFYMHHGWLPVNVDHIDGDTSNNRIDNLRAATLSENARNCRIPRRNTSGAKGVYWHSQLKKWCANIHVNKRLTHLGVFDCIFEAACARKSAEQRIYGEFAR